MECVSIARVEKNHLKGGFSVLEKNDLKGGGREKPKDACEDEYNTVSQP